MVWMAVIIKSTSQIAVSLSRKRNYLYNDPGPATLEPLTTPKQEICLIQEEPKPRTSCL